jgi:hypothetical protein
MIVLRAANPTEILMAQANLESARVTKMHEAIKKLLTEFTPPELKALRWTRSSRQRSVDRKVKNPARVCISLC